MKLIKILSIFVFVSSFSGCVWINENDDLMKFVQEIQTRPARPIKSLPAFKAYESFVYEGASLRNPFVAVVQFIPGDDADKDAFDAGDAIAPNSDRLKAYLEGFAIKDLTMVGNIKKGKDGVWALIVDTNGEIHRVTTGDYMGLDHGSVVSLNSKRINLIETISNGRGGWITRPQSIELLESKDP